MYNFFVVTLIKCCTNYDCNHFLKLRTEGSVASDVGLDSSHMEPSCAASAVWQVPCKQSHIVVVYTSGLERNSDVVVMASYAPLFVNVNDRRWNPDAIVFNVSHAYGTPSYWNQVCRSCRVFNCAHEQCESSVEHFCQRSVVSSAHFKSGWQTFWCLWPIAWAVHDLPVIVFFSFCCMYCSIFGEHCWPLITGTINRKLHWIFVKPW